MKSRRTHRCTHSFSAARCLGPLARMWRKFLSAVLNSLSGALCTCSVMPEMLPKLLKIPLRISASRPQCRINANLHAICSLVFQLLYMGHRASRQNLQKEKKKRLWESGRLTQIHPAKGSSAVGIFFWTGLDIFFSFASKSTDSRHTEHCIIPCTAERKKTDANKRKQPFACDGA